MMELIANSVWVGVGAAALAVGLGFLVALAAVSSPAWMRTAIYFTAAAALALPPFLIANVWLELTSEWRARLGAESSVHAMRPVTALVLGLMYWPIPFLFITSTWHTIQAAHLELTPQLVGRKLIYHLLFPVARPALLQSALMVLALGLSNFTIPTLFQVRVFTEEFWIRFNTTGDAAQALKCLLPLLVLAVGIIFAMRSRPISWPRWNVQFPSTAMRRQLRWWCPLAWFAFGITCWVSILVPITRLLSNRRTWQELADAWTANLGVTGVSLLTALAATLLAISVAWIGSSWKPSITGVAAKLAWLPFLLPGVLTGLALIWTCNRPGFFWLYQSPAIIVLAFAIRYLAPTWAAIESVRSHLDQSLQDQLRLDGASRWIRFRHGIWPQIAPTMAAAAYVVFLFSLWDVETAVLIQPPGGQTLALRIFNFLHYGHSTQVNALCLAMILLAMLPGIAVAIWNWIRRARTNLSPGTATRVMVLGGIGWLAAGMQLGCAPQPAPGTTPLDSHWFSAVQILGTRGVAPGQFSKPRSLVCDRDDNLYVADMTGRIQKFSPDGVFLLQWQLPQTDLGKPKGMCLDREGNIVVLEPHYQRVNHFRPDGTLITQWGRKGTNSGEFILPRAVAQSSTGDFYLSEYTLVERVQRFHPDARPSTNRAQPGVPATSIWGLPGTAYGEFNRAEGLCVGPSDQIYVADSCNHRIQIFDANGKFLRSHGHAGSNPGNISYPYDIKVEASGAQFVCEFGNSRISVFDARDQLLEILGHAGRAPGEFFNPWSICLDSQGNLYVADSQNHRIQKLLRKPSTRAQAVANRTLNGNP